MLTARWVFVRFHPHLKHPRSPLPHTGHQCTQCEDPSGRRRAEYRWLPLVIRYRMLIGGCLQRAIAGIGGGGVGRLEREGGSVTAPCSQQPHPLPRPACQSQKSKSSNFKFHWHAALGAGLVISVGRKLTLPPPPLGPPPPPSSSDSFSFSASYCNGQTQQI
jgi:hypothetical protein